MNSASNSDSVWIRQSGRARNGVLHQIRLFKKKIYQNRLKTKLMSKLVRLSHVGIHISNVIVTDYDIEIFFKLIPQSLTTSLT